MLRDWEQLPAFMRIKEVRPYYKRLKQKKFSLLTKRIFDVVVSAILLVMLSSVMLVISVAIVLDSKGGVFFCQERVTQYGKKFKIFKFRTMIANAEQHGSKVTKKNDTRITHVGSVLRKYRMDEFPQLINILVGDMSFVGTRPEATRFVKKYTKEMRATLLLPAGVTSEASILYKDEAELLNGTDDVDKVYVKQVLPEKMKYNLEGIRKFGFGRDIWTMFRTVFAVIKKDEAANCASGEQVGGNQMINERWFRGNRVRIGTLKNKNRIPEVVDVHMQSFTGFFLTFLGKGFLNQL